MNNQSEENRRWQWLRSFASLNWYEETIKFIFSFVTKTSELLLAVGIVISTANFLTDGDVMIHDKVLSDAWSWAQALAIDSSLGVVFFNAFEAVREREKVKAVIFFTLTALLASVAGLITHFDAYSHASGLPITDKSVSGFIPLWVMTALRAVAVIGFLLASRLKNISLNDLGRELTQGQELEQIKNQEQQSSSVAQSIDYNTLAVALVAVLQQVGAIQKISVQDDVQKPDSSNGNQRRRGAGTEQEPEPFTDGNQSMGTATNHCQERELTDRSQLSEKPELPRVSGTNGKPGTDQLGSDGYQEPELTHENSSMGTSKQRESKLITIGSGSCEERLRNAYQVMQVEREKITGHTLSRRACVRKQTALEWLQKQRTQDLELTGQVWREQA